MRMICITVLAIVGILARGTLALEAIARPQCSLPVEAKEIRGEDEAQFDCSARARFPQKDFDKAVSSLKDEEMKALIASYEAQKDEKADACPAAVRQVSEEEKAADQAQVSITSWINLCPWYGYSVWHWGIYLGQPYGFCYVLTPITVHKCSRPNQRCRYIYPFFWTRCRQVYRRVYFLAWCPNANFPYNFVIRWRNFPGGCDCQRLVCHSAISRLGRN